MDTTEQVNTFYILLMGSLGMLLLAGAVIFLFVIYFKRSIKANKALHQMEKKHQQDIIYTNLQTLEDERKRFAEDLHDDIGASLSAIRLHVSGLEKEEGTTAIKDKLHELKSILDQSMASTRRISHNMLPPGLDVMGLAYVIEDFKKQIPEPVIHIDLMPGLPKLSYNIELTLYRILQELLNNTIRHAKATEVSISLHSNEDKYLVSYSDNGIGFDAEKVRYTGLGLSNLQSRVSMINGQLEFNTSPGNGIRVKIEVPV